MRKISACTIVLSLAVGCVGENGSEEVGELAVDNPVTIMGAGDIAESGSVLLNATATGNLIRNANPAYVFIAGDNAYPDGTDSDYATKYDPTWGSFKAKTLPTPGNHEYHVNPPAGYINYFGLANVSYDANNTHVWYAKDLGNGWRFYSLNTEVSASTGSAQELWLRNDLAAHPGMHYVAVTHHPRYVSATSHPDSTSVCPLWNDLQAAGGDLMLVGHEHHYERFAKMDCNGALAANGIREFLVGSGGNQLYPLPASPHFGQEAVLASDFGVLKLVLHNASYDWQFIASGRCWNGSTSVDCASRTGMVLDAGSAATNNGAGPSGNAAPTVSAGPDLSVTLPASAGLDATVSDDGLPDPPAAVTASWSNVSGPGTVTFGNASAVDTTATFSAAGVYVLRLTASDSALSTSDDVQVTVSTTGGATIIDRAVAASADDAEENASTGSVQLSSSDLELVNDGSTNQRVGIRFANMTIPRSATITRAYVQFTVDETVGSTGLNLTVKGFAQDNTAAFTTTANNIGSRPVTGAVVTGWNPPLWTPVGATGVGQQTPELKAVVQEIVNRPGWASGNAIGIVVTGPGGVRTAGAFDNGIGSQPVLHVEYAMSTGNSAPTTSAGPDRTVTLPSSASLDGTISDDGLPNPPAAVTSSWSKVSGPGTVTFGNASAVDTTATFSAAGVYVLRLTASDSALSTSDDVQVTVSATGGATIIDRAVAASADDAEEVASSGSVQLSSSDLELVNDGSTNQRVGMRFVNMTIPRNATITRAYVQFTIDETVGSTGLNLTVKGFALDNAATFTTATFNISSRPVTAASVTGWNPPLWTLVGAAGADQRTPELKAVVQEIVNRTGWVSGNALGIVVTGPGGVRTAGAFDNGIGSQPVLHVEYTTP